MKRVLIGVLVLSLTLALAGCKSVSEKIGEEVGEQIAGGVVGGTVEVDGDAVTIETEDGAVTMNSSEGTLPKDFPKDFPVYDDMTVDSASSIASGEEITFYVNFTSDDSVTKIYEWYKGEFGGSGWTPDGDYLFTDEDGESGMLSGTKGTLSGTVTITKGDSSTEVGMIVVQAK